MPTTTGSDTCCGGGNPRAIVGYDAPGQNMQGGSFVAEGRVACFDALISTNMDGSSKATLVTLVKSRSLHSLLGS